MRRRIAEVASLALVWAALWADLDLATLTSGVLVCVIVLWLVPPSTFGRLGRIRPWRSMVFLVSTLGRLVVANFVVAREALRGGRDIQEAIIEVDVGDVSEEVATMIATSISLAPGTVAVGIRPGVIYAHCLHAADLDHERRRLHDQAEEVKGLFVSGEEPS